ncbi:hypothetical protein QMT30_17630 [Cronobacter sakazakii]|nr:hypothetical protein [Cronobacter sakazakii]MDK1241517.1 hypothetical protein [Cronobacter sakazakii]
MTDTAKLKAAALAAGGEEWAPRDQTKNYGEYTVIVKDSLEKHSGCTSYRPIADGVVNKQVMKFIALANPAAVLELIAALEAALAECRENAARIAELEARKVKLPKRSVGEVMYMSGFSRDYAEGWCSGNDNARHEIQFSGINLETGGEA